MASVTQPTGYMIAFDSSHDAMKSEVLLSDLEGRLVPTPTAIHASCGLAYRGTVAAEMEEAVRRCREGNLRQFAVYRFKGRGPNLALDFVSEYAAV